MAETNMEYYLWSNGPADRILKKDSTYFGYYRINEIFTQIGAEEASSYTDTSDYFNNFKQNKTILNYLIKTSEVTQEWVKTINDTEIYDFPYKKRNTAAPNLVVKGTTLGTFTLTATSDTDFNVTSAKIVSGPWVYGTEESSNYIEKIKISRKQNSDNNKFGFCITTTKNNSSTSTWIYAENLGLSSLPWCLTCILWGGGGCGGKAAYGSSLTAAGGGGGGGGGVAVAVLDFSVENIFNVDLGRYGDPTESSKRTGGQTNLKIDNYSCIICKGGSYGKSGIYKETSGKGGDVSIYEHAGVYKLSTKSGGDGGNHGYIEEYETKHQAEAGEDRESISPTMWKTSTGTVTGCSGGAYGETDHVNKLVVCAGGGGGASLYMGGTSAGAHLYSRTSPAWTSLSTGILGGGGAGGSVLYDYKGKIATEVKNPTTGGRGGVIFLY